MKKIIIAAVLTALTIQPSMANEDNNPIEVCDAMSKLTKAVMNLRQAGEPLSEMLKDSKNARGSEIAIIKNAYDYPVFKGYHISPLDGERTGVYVKYESKNPPMNHYHI